MSTVIVLTYAYNTEKTLERAVSSILAQTHGDFIYYLIDNGSTDNTPDIMRRCAATDGRIRLVHYDDKYMWRFVDRLLPEILHEFSGDCCLCTLDADDEYLPTFFADMLMYMDQHHLEMAACGNMSVNTQGGKRSEHRLPGNLVVGSADYAESFVVYFRYLRTIWGKMFRLSLLARCEFSCVTRPSHHNGDTMFTLEAFSHTDRIGILSKVLQIYYIYPVSVSSGFDAGRIANDAFMFEKLHTFLDSYGAISDANQLFICDLYYVAVRTTLEALLKASLTLTDTLGFMAQIFGQTLTKQMLTQGLVTGDARNDYFDRVIKWLAFQSSHADVASQKTIDVIVGDLSGYIDSRTTSSPLIGRICANLAFRIWDTVMAVLGGDLRGALDSICSHTQERGIEFTRVGMNLSAAAEDEGMYVSFAKRYISDLIDAGRIEEAKAELSDYLTLLPEEFEGLARRIPDMQG